MRYSLPSVSFTQLIRYHACVHLELNTAGRDRRVAPGPWFTAECSVCAQIMLHQEKNCVSNFGRGSSAGIEGSRNTKAVDGFTRGDQSVRGRGRGQGRHPHLSESTDGAAHGLIGDSYESHGNLVHTFVRLSLFVSVCVYYVRDIFHCGPACPSQQT